MHIEGLPLIVICEARKLHCKQCSRVELPMGECEVECKYFSYIIKVLPLRKGRRRRVTTLRVKELLTHAIE